MYITKNYTSPYSPLSDDMIQYARTDTHYLLYIYDCVRAQLLDLNHEQPGLLQCVWNKSKDIALKVCKDLTHFFVRYPGSFIHSYFLDPCIEVSLVWVCIQSAVCVFIWAKPQRGPVKVNCSYVLGLVCLFSIPKWSSCICFIVINCWVQWLEKLDVRCRLMMAHYTCMSYRCISQEDARTMIALWTIRILNLFLNYYFNFGIILMVTHEIVKSLERKIR